jgi:hypothetical protein
VNATCCEQGRTVVYFAESFGWNVASEFDYGIVDDIKFCPFCGHDLNAPATLEEAIASLLESPFPLDICFDVDGVCANDQGYKPYADRQPYPWVPGLMRKLKEAGHRLKFQTARYMLKYDGDQRKASEAGGQELRWWLKCHDIPYDEVYLGKCSADVYVDDRGCRVESNAGSIDWLRNFVPEVKKAQDKKRAQRASCQPTHTGASADTPTKSSVPS